KHDRRSLIRLMTGREPTEPKAREAAAHARMPVLGIRGLTLRGVLADVSLDVFPGEIVGLAGLVGAGRSEVLESVFGLHPELAGEITLGGRQTRFRTPRAAAKAGTGFVPAARKLLGLVPRQPRRGDG